jgi:hypothetical protein
MSSPQVSLNPLSFLSLWRMRTTTLLPPISIKPVAKVPYTTRAAEAFVPGNRGVDAKENTIPAR